jgi:hypothetical protein
VADGVPGAIDRLPEGNVIPADDLQLHAVLQHGDTSTVKIPPSLDR